jgi:hypothetical protein
MTLAEGAEAFMALFGATGDKARRGALLLATVLFAYLPELPTVVVDEEL